jgi:hypothetical protein
MSFSSKDFTGLVKYSGFTSNSSLIDMNTYIPEFDDESFVDKPIWTVPLVLGSLASPKAAKRLGAADVGMRLLSGDPLGAAGTAFYEAGQAFPKFNKFVQQKYDKLGDVLLGDILGFESLKTNPLKPGSSARTKWLKEITKLEQSPAFKAMNKAQQKAAKLALTPKALHGNQALKRTIRRLPGKLGVAAAVMFGLMGAKSRKKQRDKREYVLNRNRAILAQNRAGVSEVF